MRQKWGSEGCTYPHVMLDIMKNMDGHTLNMVSPMERRIKNLSNKYIA